jgi:hypothetical protein
VAKFRLGSIRLGTFAIACIAVLAVLLPQVGTAQDFSAVVQPSNIQFGALTQADSDVSAHEYFGQLRLGLGFLGAGIRASTFEGSADIDDSSTSPEFDQSTKSTSSYLSLAFGGKDGLILPEWFSIVPFLVSERAETEQSLLGSTLNRDTSTEASLGVGLRLLGNLGQFALSYREGVEQIRVDASVPNSASATEEFEAPFRTASAIYQTNLFGGRSRQ